MKLNEILHNMLLMNIHINTQTCFILISEQKMIVITYKKMYVYLFLSFKVYNAIR